MVVGWSSMGGGDIFYFMVDFLWLLFYVWVFYLLGGGASGSGRGFMGRSLTQERRNKNDMTTKRRKK